MELGIRKQVFTSIASILMASAIIFLIIVTSINLIKIYNEWESDHSIMTQIKESCAKRGGQIAFYKNIPPKTAPDQLICSL